MGVSRPLKSSFGISVSTRDVSIPATRIVAIMLDA
jgi:hypothetical protein